MRASRSFFSWEIWRCLRLRSAECLRRSSAAMATLALLSKFSGRGEWERATARAEVGAAAELTGMGAEWGGKEGRPERGRGDGAGREVGKGVNGVGVEEEGAGGSAGVDGRVGELRENR